MAVGPAGGRADGRIKFTHARTHTTPQEEYFLLPCGVMLLVAPLLQRILIGARLLFD